jgi:undecaprenyl phosphate-alpha-L-ara4N flippase subunit ArnF
LKTALILTAIIAVTLVGDYLIKLASQRAGHPTSVTFLVGALLYALPAIGWFYLMRSHSLAAIGVFYSSATILILAGLGYFVFNEGFGLRELLGVSLAIAAVVVMSH